MPSPNKDESKKEYMSRCMGSEEANKDFPDQKQRYAFCSSKWESKAKKKKKNKYVDAVKDYFKPE